MYFKAGTDKNFNERLGGRIEFRISKLFRFYVARICLICILYLTLSKMMTFTFLRRLISVPESLTQS